MVFFSVSNGRVRIQYYVMTVLFFQLSISVYFQFSYFLHISKHGYIFSLTYNYITATIYFLHNINGLGVGFIRIRPNKIRRYIILLKNKKYLNWYVFYELILITNGITVTYHDMKVK